ncbi:hypothetical protein FRB90_010317, partial [Tulasnella sp. 427]
MAIFSKTKQPPDPVEKPSNDDSTQGKQAVVVDAKGGEAPTAETVPPVGFTQLFRYSTKLELFFNGIGL